MRPPCEVVVKEVLPAMRAMLVRELTERHQMNQVEVARRLGITQPAVSHYLRMARGVRQKSPVIKSLEKRVGEFACEISNRNLNHKQMIASYCGICRSLSKKQILCLLHFKTAPYLQREGCSVCFSGKRSG
ncbi:MAG: hypothetical protein AB1476_04015 [Candidatus Hadarchaeota archaeon]